MLIYLDGVINLIFLKMSYREYCEKDNIYQGGSSATKRYNDALLNVYPLFNEYFDIKYN